MKKAGKYEIPSVQACFAMLESLSHHPGGVLLSEIVEAGVLPLASAFRMAVVLEGLGYVARDPETKRIRLTDKLLLLGQRALTERGILELSQGPMRALRDQVGGTVLDKAGYPLAAIWTTGLKTDIRPNLIPALGKAVRDAAGKVSALMGCGNS